MLACLSYLKECSHLKNRVEKSSRQSIIFCFSAIVMLLPTLGPQIRTIRVISSICLLLNKKRIWGNALGFRFKTLGSLRLMGESLRRLGAFRSVSEYTWMLLILKDE